LPTRSASRLGFILKLIGKSFRPATGEQHKPVLVDPSDLGVTFIGHASFLLQVGGLNFLVDPVFAYWLILVHRLRKPGVRIQDLPPIDAVLLTHAHMDHLNLPSLRKIIRHTRRITGKAPIAIIPERVEDLVAGLGFSDVRSLDWWQSTSVGGVEITMTPAQHWGARVIRDVHRRYGGYVLRHGPHSVYHCGDTGYFPIFDEIRRRLAPQTALLPIGAYSPHGFLHVHMDPEDAVRAFMELDARHFVPMHYGTFRLSAEPMEEPLPRLLKAAKDAGIASAVDALREGETRIFSSRQHTSVSHLPPRAMPSRLKGTGSAPLEGFAH
jgi:L-ascorbate metabolism protein UlaG (beta-lactamase superfamily)